MIRRPRCATLGVSLELVPRQMRLFRQNRGERMVQTFLDYFLAIYLSSFMFIIVPMLGLVVGAITAGITPRVSVVFGALVGLASGSVGLALTFTSGFTVGEGALVEAGPWGWITTLFLFPLGGVLAPAIAIPFIGLRRTRKG